MKQALDRTDVQRAATVVLALPVISRWARPSERMLNVHQALRSRHGIDDVQEWARWAFRTRGVKR